MGGIAQRRKTTSDEHRRTWRVDTRLAVLGIIHFRHLLSESPAVKPHCRSSGALEVALWTQRWCSPGVQPWRSPPQPRNSPSLLICSVIWCWNACICPFPSLKQFVKVAVRLWTSRPPQSGVHENRQREEESCSNRTSLGAGFPRSWSTGPIQCVPPRHECRSASH